MLKITLFGLAAIVLFTIPPAVYFFTHYYRVLEDEVVARFSGQRWDIPSRIYSDSTVIYPGQSLGELDFFQRLARLNYHRVKLGEVKARGEYSFDGQRGALVIFLHSFAYPYRRFNGELVAVNITRDGIIGSIEEPLSHHRLYSIELEPELISGIFQGDWRQRRLVRLAQIPPALVDAILAAEDHRFYEHHGVDLARIFKAAWVDLTRGQLRQGGSTLTQQLMKNFFLTSQRTWKRKIKEALMAYIAERLYSKDEIVENYINDIYLGQRGQEGIYGVWEASEYYFSKEPRDLTIGEMATLAGMIRAPNALNPLRHPEPAKRRRAEVLTLMLEDGYISKAAYEEARIEPLHSRAVFMESNEAPYFTDYVKHELAERYPPQVLVSEGLRIFTTLDVHLEKLAERVIARNLEALEAAHPKLRRKQATERLESCLVALEPQSGKIRAMVGGRDYRQSQFNRVTQSRRQPGSVFKPVTYLAAFDETLSGGPERYLPTSYIEDAPFTWTYANGMSWTPVNYKNYYFGRVTLEFALEQSLNSATSRLAYAVGLERILEMARKLGFGNLPAYPSIVLGGVEASPMQVARAYAIMANQGMQVEPYAVTEVVDGNGGVIQGLELKAHQVLSPELAYMIDFMLEQVIDHGTAMAARRAGFTRPAAAKTGTTNDYNDAWLAGFTPNLLAVVWTGFDQKEALGLTGAQASLPAWTDFMKAGCALRPPLDFSMPPGIMRAKVDPLSECVAPPLCGPVVEGVFPKAMAPTKACSCGATPLSATVGAGSADDTPVAPAPEPND